MAKSAGCSQTYARLRRGENNWLTLVPGPSGHRLRQRGNCFLKIDDLPRAQELLARLHRLDWAAVLSRFSRRFNPWCAAENAIGFRGYYWSFPESEYATDIVFRNAVALGEIYPSLVRHAMNHFLSPDVLRFFSRRLTKRFADEITTTSRTGTKRRVEICHAANGRYLDALAEAEIPAPAHEVLDPVSRPIVRRGRHYRALRPLCPDDSRLLRILLSGAYHHAGFRNRDIYHETRWPLAVTRC